MFDVTAEDLAWDFSKGMDVWKTKDLISIS